MPTYYFLDVRVLDTELYALYVRDAPATVAAHGGRFVIRNPAVSVLSGNWGFSRLIVIEFASREAFDRWYQSAEYRRLLDLRKRCTEVREAVVEGVAPVTSADNTAKQVQEPQ